MHIPDILPAQVAIAGYGLTGLTTWACLKRINRLPDPQAQVPKASLLTAAFFVASWIHIPTPLASVHFVLNGLLGVLLGWFAFPAILIGLLFQAVMFQHGGLSTLGVNALVMGLPALLAHLLFQMGRMGLGRRGAAEQDLAESDMAALNEAHRKGGGNIAESGMANNKAAHSAQTIPRWLLASLGFVAGAVGLGLAVAAFFSTMVIFLPAHLDAALEQRAIALLCLAHLPVIALEGGFTAMLVLFLDRVKPELLPELPRRSRPAHRLRAPAEATIAASAGPTWQEGGQ